MKLQESDYGLIPRSFHNLLELIAVGEKKGISYTLKASYFELYNEQVRWPTSFTLASLEFFVTFFISTHEMKNLCNLDLNQG